MLWAFVRRLECYEPGLVDTVLWGLGWRIGDVLLSWRKNIDTLVRVIETTGSGWGKAPSGWVARGQIIRGRLRELGDGTEARMLRFVQDMALPWARMRLRTPDGRWYPGHVGRFHERQTFWCRRARWNAVPMPVDGGFPKSHRSRACPKCAHKGFNLTTALVAALPAGAARVLWALVAGVEPAKGGAWRTAMREFDRIEAEARRPVDGAAMPGVNWLREHCLTCRCWAFTMVVREGRRVGGMGMPDYGVWGLDDVGTVHHVRPLLLKDCPPGGARVWEPIEK